LAEAPVLGISLMYMVAPMSSSPVLASRMTPLTVYLLCEDTERDKRIAKQEKNTFIKRMSGSMTAKKPICFGIGN
jgi:hypothetical protein